MITSIFDQLLDGDSFIVLDPDSFYREDGIYYLFEKTCPESYSEGRKTVIMNARRMPDQCYCIVPGHQPVVRVGAMSHQLASDWDFANAKKDGDMLDEE